jgi:hypothetical protein
MEKGSATLVYEPRQGPVGALRRFAQARAPEEHCDFCAVPLSTKHRHLLEVAKRHIVCVCDPCALRFQNTVGGRFKMIPRDPRALPGFQINDAEWERLALPINLAFFFHNSVTGKNVAMYPSPAGAMESLLPLASWAEFAENNPSLPTMEADTEALLVNRVGSHREYFIAPIDACYELVGLIRAHWRGLSGGEYVWLEIGKFFTQIHETAVAPGPKPSEVCHA